MNARCPLSCLPNFPPCHAYECSAEHEYQASFSLSRHAYRNWQQFRYQASFSPVMFELDPNIQVKIVSLLTWILRSSRSMTISPLILGLLFNPRRGDSKYFRHEERPHRMGHAYECSAEHEYQASPLTTVSCLPELTAIPV